MSVFPGPCPVCRSDQTQALAQYFQCLACARTFNFDGTEYVWQDVNTAVLPPLPDPVPPAETVFVTTHPTAQENFTQSPHGQTQGSAL